MTAKTEWSMEQQEAVKHYGERIALIRNANKETEWMYALGAFFLFSPIFIPMFLNLVLGE